MKKVILSIAMNRGGELVESGSMVCLSDQEADKIVENGNGKLVTATENKDVKEIDIDKLKTADLEKYAKELGIDISGCKNNEERKTLLKETLAEKNGNDNNKAAETQGNAENGTE